MPTPPAGSPTLVLVPTDASASETSSAFEINVLATCRLTKRLTIRGGYQLLWINDLAVASEQLRVNDVIEGGAGGRVDASSNLFYHGFVLGAELRW